MTFDNDLAISGLKAAIGDFMFKDGKTKYSIPIDAEHLFHYTYPVYKNPSHIDIVVNDTTRNEIIVGNGYEKNMTTVYVVNEDGRKLTLKMIRETTISQLIPVVAQHQSIPADTFRFLYSGRILDNNAALKVIGNDCVLHMLFRQSAGGYPAYHIESDFFDAKFNYDFSKITDKQNPFFRGGKEYRRPIGSKRYAIKVDGKYPNDDNWLGCNGGFDEWPVAYHGMKENNSLDIAKNGFDLSKGKRFLYGHGIYCTPDPATAKRYAVEYTYKGKRFHMIFQNRVNPKTMIVVKESDPNGLGEYWLVPDKSDIRPYGICVFSA